MPEHIKTEHIARMFPFEFFDELNEKLNGYTLTNPAFLAHLKTPLSKEQRAKLFAKSRTEEILSVVNRNNILDVEPFGELLHLDLCAKTEDAEKLVGTQTERSQVPISILVGQLYDTAGLPVFSKEVTEDSIKQIPEVLHDDPNLLLAVLAFGETETTVGIIHIPKFLEKKLFEPTPDENE